MTQQQDRDVNLLIHVILISQVFYCDNESGKRTYLKDVLTEHLIFKEKTRWLDCINFAIDTKCAEEMAAAPQNKSPNKAKGIFRLLRAMRKKSTSIDPETRKKNAFMVLS